MEPKGMFYTTTGDYSLDFVTQSPSSLPTLRSKGVTEDSMRTETDGPYVTPPLCLLSLCHTRVS